MPESLEFAFDSCIKGTMLEEATLDIEIVSALGDQGIDELCSWLSQQVNINNQFVKHVSD